MSWLIKETVRMFLSGTDLASRRVWWSNLEEDLEEVKSSPDQESAS